MKKKGAPRWKMKWCEVDWDWDEEKEKKCKMTS